MKWQKINRNPNHYDVYNFLRDYLIFRYRGLLASDRKLIKLYASNRHVLDIGAVRHSIDQTLNNEWRHKIISDVASSVVGIDILKPEILELQKRGYDIREVDATSDMDIGRKFDYVFIGDVIEHVSSPVALLKFARRHLNNDGVIHVITPNPHFYGHIYKACSITGCIPNAEHVAWISPSMAIELGSRADLMLSGWWHTGGDSDSYFRRFFNKLMHYAGIRNFSLFSVSIIYEFKYPE